MGLFGPSKAELEQDQAVFELMCLIAQVDGDFSEKEMAGIGQRILTLGEGKSFFKSWTKKGELQQERLDEAIRQFQTKSISLESGASIVTSIEPLLDDYKDAIKKKYREDAFKILLVIASDDLSLDGDEALLLKKIAEKFKIKDKKFNQFYEEAELRVIEEKTLEKESFLEEVSKIPSLSKKEAEFIGEELDYDTSQFAQFSSDQLRELVPGLKKDVAEALIRRFG